MTPPSPPPPPSPRSSDSSASPASPAAGPARGPEAGAANASWRRGRYALNSSITALAATAACGFLLLIASGLSVQVTALSTREHVLAERTKRMIESLEADYHVVVAANFVAVDAEGARRTLDVLDTFERASERIDVTVLNIAHASGVDRFTALMKELAEVHEAKIDEQVKAIAEAATSAEDVAARLNALDADLTRAAEAVPADWKDAAALEDVLKQRATASRLLAGDLTEAATGASASLGTQLELAPIPPLDLAFEAIRPALRSVSEQTGQMVRDMERLSDGRANLAPPVVIDALKPALETGRRARDAALRAGDALDRMPPLAILRVVRTLETTSAVLVIGPPDGPRGGVTAVDFSALFPPRPPGDERPFQLDQRQRAEELLATALATVSDERLPIVVFVHGEESRFEPQWRVFRQAMERLALRGVDVAEWPVALQSEQPDLSAIANAAERPVVYLVIPTLASSPQAAARMGRLATTVEQLIARGEDVLLNVQPSTLPTTGNPDPMVAFLQEYGITVDTGRPLLREVQVQDQRVVTPIFDVMGEEGEHALGGAIRGLRARLPWPTPVRFKPKGDGTELASIIRIADAGDAWAEADWVSFSQVPSSQRASILNPPDEDSPRDDGDGPWTVAAAAELAREDGDPQRLVIVTAGFGWMADQLTQVRQVVNQREVFVFPGNLELLESSVFWLAGRDEYVATSAAAQDLARIKPIPPGQMLAIRWLLIGGLPLAVLLAGALVRLLRG